MVRQLIDNVVRWGLEFPGFSIGLLWEALGLMRSGGFDI